MISSIRSENKRIPVEFLCQYFGISRSGYYYWEKSRATVHFVKKESICRVIRSSFETSKGTYGSPRIWRELRDKGYSVSENTVAKYMAEMGLDARLKKRFKVQTTNSNHSGPIADRLFRVEDHHTMPKAPGQVIAGDITYLRLGTGFLYLAVVIDIFTREVVGWSMGRNLQTTLVLNALEVAMKRLGPDVEVIFHSDRGSQYASDAYRKLCKNKKITPSMSRRGNCYDNAYVESWFSSLKKEWLYRSTYTTEPQLRTLVFDYIEVWYNRKRRHSALDYMSPMQFKEVHQAVQ